MASRELLEKVSCDKLGTVSPSAALIMATAKKKTSTRTKKTAPKAKKPSARKTTKTVATKKTTKKTTARKTTAKKSPRKTAKATKKRASSRVVDTRPKQPVSVTRKRWYHVVIVSVLALVLVLAGALSINPDLINRLPASLVTLMDGSTVQVVPDGPEDQAGILVAYETAGKNEQKLKDIFRTVFPGIGIKTVPYQSTQGQEILQTLSLSEVPNIVFEKDAFEEESLSEVVKDLFEERGDYYVLNVSLVNPSDQRRVASSPLSQDGAVTVGDRNAPITLHLYSQPKCQHCRVLQENTAENFAELVQEGLLQIHFIDLPQNAENTYHVIALECVGEQRPEDYWDTRNELYTRTNLSRSYTNRVLTRLDLDIDEDCDASAERQQLRNRVKRADQEGISGLPAVYISRTDENSYLRITGAKPYREYQEVFDALLQNVAFEASQQEELKGAADDGLDPGGNRRVEDPYPAVEMY